MSFLNNRDRKYPYTVYTPSQTYKRHQPNRTSMPTPTYFKQTPPTRPFFAAMGVLTHKTGSTATTTTLNQCSATNRLTIAATPMFVNGQSISLCLVPVEQSIGQ